MTDIDIVPMTYEHLPQVLGIEQSVFTTPWTEEMFRQEVEGVFGSRTLVAVNGGRVVGYQIAWIFDDEVHLVNIAVNPSFQHKRIGTRLLMHLIEESIDTAKKVVTLEVRASNLGAQAFYRLFGFRTIGVRKGYYTDNREDALLMWLDLERLPAQGSIGEGQPRAS